MILQPSRPQSIGGVLDTAFYLYKAAFTRVWGLSCLLLIAPSLILLGDTALDPASTATPFWETTLAFWLAGLLNGLLSVWVVGALYLQEGAIGAGELLGTAPALRAALGRALPMLLTLFLAALAVLLGFILLIVPGVMLMVYLLFGANLVLFEHKGPIEALLGSLRLVRGSWGRTTVIITVGSAVISAMYSAAAFVAAVLVPLLLRGTDVATAARVGGLVAGLAINLLVTPFYVALSISTYWDLKLRKEGADLAPRISALPAA